MSLKLFSAYHQNNTDNVAYHYSEKKMEGNQLWILGVIPGGDGEEKKILEDLQVVVEDILVHQTESEDHEENFEITLKKANELLAEKLDEKKSEEVLRMGSLMIAFLNEGELFLSAYGQGEVFLLRDGVLSEISEGLSPKKEGTEFFQNISSGVLQNGDHIIFSTIRLQRYLTEKQISALLADGVLEAKECISSAIDPDEKGGVTFLHVKSTESMAFQNVEQPSLGDTFGEAPKRRVPVRSVSFDENFRQLKKWARSLPVQKTHVLLAGAAIIGVFLIFLFFSVLSQEETIQTNAEFDAFISEGYQRGISNVNTLKSTGKINDANIELNKMKEMANKMLTERYSINDAQKFLENINLKTQEINNIKQIKNPDIAADLTTLKGNISARGMYFFQNELYVYDADTLYKSTLTGDEPEEVGVVTSSDEILHAVDFSNKDRAVFLTKGENILEWQDGQVTSSDTADETWKSATDIATYAKYVYFLDPGENQIWKYERRDSSYTTASGWIGEDVDISNAVSIAIDGNIFVLTNEGKIMRFYRGALNPATGYEIKGFPGEFRGDVMYTNDRLSYLFILDKEENRIIVLNKGENSATYEKQILLEDMGELKDIFATESQVFVLGEGRVFVEKL